MKQSNKLLTILLFIYCPLAFAGTGSAKDGSSIVLILVGILAIIFGTPHVIRFSKAVWRFIKRKIKSYFSSINIEEKIYNPQISFKQFS